MKHNYLSAVIGTLCASLLATSSFASSHREAPNITRSPALDSTDFYAFNSYESGRADFVTLIANYYPFQDPWGGPNYFALDEDARYRIHIDTSGDGTATLTSPAGFWIGPGGRGGDGDEKRLTSGRFATSRANPSALRKPAGLIHGNGSVRWNARGSIAASALVSGSSSRT